MRRKKAVEAIQPTHILPQTPFWATPERRTGIYFSWV